MSQDPGSIDLSGVNPNLQNLYNQHNLYNQNDGVVQGQICGQALFTKLLRSGKKRKGGVPLSLNKDPTSSSLCISPSIGKPMKLKFHRNNLYENMNMSSHDTESCTSEELFSETTSTSATIDEFQSPEFVAQFDPLQLAVNNSNPSSPPLPQEQQPLQRQAMQPKNSTPGSGRKLTWSSSLPAVVEEADSLSQSEQGSQPHPQQRQQPPGIWRNGQESPEQEGLGHKEQILQQRGAPAMSLLEIDRISSPRSIPHAIAAPSPPSIPHSRAMSETPKSKRGNDPKTKMSKAEYMKDAVNRRIRQVMEENISNVESDVSALESTDSYMGTPTAVDARRGIPTMFDSFPNQGSASKAIPIVPRPPYRTPDQKSVPETTAPDVSTTMQDLLLQQQMTLKEMSQQNSHYRQELNECQDIFGKWRQERDKQRSTIQDLVKEKEAYASEASFLRDEMTSIRQELEALRMETRLQAGYQIMQSPPQQQPNQHDRKVVQQQHRHQHTPSPYEHEVRDPRQNVQSLTPPQQQQPKQSPYERKVVQPQQKQSPYEHEVRNNHQNMQSPLQKLQQQHGHQQSPYEQAARDLPSHPQKHRHNQQQEPSHHDYEATESCRPFESSKDQHGQQEPSPYEQEAMEFQPFQGFRHQQPQQESPFKDGQPPVSGQQQRKEPPFRNGAPPLPIPMAALSPPPPPPPTRTSRSNKQELSPPRSKSNSKPLVSGLKSSDSAKKNRSVKFHDPPKSKEWTLFPNELHDDRLLECSFQDSRFSPGNHSQGSANSRHNNNTLEMESQHELGEEPPMLVNVNASTHYPPSHGEEEPTPVAANGRAAEQTDVTNVYKNRLEAIQKNRQQRVGKNVSIPNANSRSGTPGQKKKRSSSRRPPMAQDCPSFHQHLEG